MRLPALPGLLQFGQAAARAAIRDCAAERPDSRLLAVDATCGNGNDSLFLARTFKEMHPGKPFAVVALDIQQEALERASDLLARNGHAEDVRLILRGHEDLEIVLRQEKTHAETCLAAIMYNLGYLPGSDKRIVTRAASTLASLEAGLHGLAAKGMLSIHAYGGHPGGAEELEAVDRWCSRLDPDIWIAARYAIHNKLRKPEALFLIRKRNAP